MGENTMGVGHEREEKCLEGEEWEAWRDVWVRQVNRRIIYVKDDNDSRHVSYSPVEAVMANVNRCNIYFSLSLMKE